MESLDVYKDDFTFLTAVKNFVKSHILGETVGVKSGKGNPIFTYFPDGRTIRLVFPHGSANLKPYLQGHLLYYVGFIGFCRPTESLEDGLNEMAWKMDGDLIAELSEYPDIVGYFSAERTLGGEWGNLVLFKSMDGVSDWRNSAIHLKAVNKISPKYYTEVRIHGGQLRDGLSGQFDTDRTIFLDYTNEPSISRVLRKWKNE